VPSLAAQNTGLQSPQFISYENRSTGIYTYDYDLDLTV
jgi:hypothetical protein